MSDSAPWFDEYEQFGIPETLAPYPDEPAHSFLYESADAHPEQGLVQRGEKVTFPELAEMVDRLASALADHGVGKGDRVATILPTSIQFVLADYAISRAGGVHIPNDVLDADDDLRYRLEQGDPEVLIGQDDHRELLCSLRDDLAIEHLILTDIADYSDDPPSDHDDVADAEWLPNVIEDTDDAPPEIDFDPEEDVHTLLFTGGTTGRPKGCLLTHRNVTANALQATANMSRMAQLMRGGETALMALPLYHAYGYSVLHSLIELGLDVLTVPDARDTGTMRDLIETHDPVIMMGVPTQFMEIVDEELGQDIIGISGSAPLASETKDAFAEQSTGVSQGYGLSEMSPITHFNTRGLLDMMTGGSSDDGGFDQPTIGVPVPDTEVKLVDVDSGEPIPLDEAIDDEREGELYLNGPQRMQGYLDADKQPFDDEGFVSTGDVAKIDESGRFYVVDRVKDMINVSGLKVYSEEVDEELFGHPGVKRPATVGVPDPERPGSERVKVYIEPDPDYDGDLTEDEIVDFLQGRVAKHAVPAAVEIVEQVPLTDIGKTDKKALRERTDPATEAAE
ncbi:acyl--CoA ligase [Halococcus dombrowskii]|uniref:Acyl--CoA ligase n=1 Tax=Halococcus dombrowskii TaxID=179637 RepID=A0AAV3SEU9_HALDO|nr:class I adenylate-forming enzyme family protein [Halococcus dombrowskii]UOO94652.1 acyl--CoA ligase [Halococcus dombrowskii]